MSVKSNLIEYYAQRAGEYERVYGKPERQEELRQLKELIKSRLAGRNVLEVACGTGYWTEVAATSAHTITAFDINEAVLAIARGKSLDPRKVTFQAGDAYQPPGRGDFDAALVAFWWSHVPKQKLAGFLRALHKTLRPGAVVIFMDNTLVPGNSTPLGRADRHGNTYQMRQLADGSTFEVLKNYPDERELREAIGLYAEQVELKWLQYYWWLSYCRRKA